MQADKQDLEILLITHKYPPSVGGMQKQSYELIKRLETYAIVHKIIFNGKYPKALFLIFAPFFAIIKIAKHPGIGIVHANDGLMALSITPLLWLTQKNLTATVHGLDIVFKSAFYQYWIRHFLAKFSFIIAVSEETRQECISRGVPENIVHFIPNGFEPATGFVPDQDVLRRLQTKLKIDFRESSILCSIGRPIKRKGFVWFVENVLDQIKFPVVYIIVGPREKHVWLLQGLSKVLPSALFLKFSRLFGLGMEALKLDDLMARERYRERLVFTGHLPQAELNNLLFHADLFIMPNIKVEGDYEGFGLVALEAAAMGTVCLAAEVDGIPSAVKHNVNGILLPPGDAAAWSTTINQLAEPPEKLKQLGQTFKANTESQMHSWQEMAHSYFTLFTQAARHKNE